MQPTPNPPGATYSIVLTGVSCASAHACTAVGYYESSPANQVLLAERWDGRRWAIQTIPNPGATYTSELDGVSCVSAYACTAVGQYFSPSFFVSDRSLAERWDGTRWAVQSTPNAPGGLSSDLYGVSCVSASACTAVGQGGLIESWTAPKREVQVSEVKTAADRLAGQLRPRRCAAKARP